VGAGFGLTRSTTYRYLDEVVEVAVAQALGLREALERALARGTPKTHDLGGSIQALFYPSGIPLWVSDVLPGNVRGLAAARENVLGALRPFLQAMPVLADPGYEGAGHGVHVPVMKPARVKEPGINTRAHNALLRSARCPGERGLAHLAQRFRTIHLSTLCSNGTKTGAALAMRPIRPGLAVTC
jgi:hypothetical protein